MNCSNPNKKQQRQESRVFQLQRLSKIYPEKALKDDNKDDFAAPS